MKQEILAVKVKSLSCDTESNNINVYVREFWNDTTAIPEFIHTTPGENLAYPEDSNELCYKVVHKQCNSR